MREDVLLVYLGEERAGLLLHFRVIFMVSIIFGLVLRRSQNYRVGCSFIKLLGYISTFAILLGFFFDNFAYLVDDSMNLLQHLLFVFIHKICIMNEKHIISVR